MDRNRFGIGLLLFLNIGVAANAFADTPEDKLNWLEELKTPRVEAWVKEENAKTMKRLGTGPAYEERYEQAMKILTKHQVINLGEEQNGFEYEFYRPEGAKEGVWRRSPWKDFIDKKPKWEVLLDIDKMNTEEKATLSFSSASCVKPSYERCLLSFSNAGSDARSTREFDLKTKNFVKDGFALPHSKSAILWNDQDSVFLLDSLTKDSQTRNLQARKLRLWKRAEKLEDSQLLYEASTSDLKIFVSEYPSNDKKVIVFGSTKEDRTKVRKIYRDGKITALDLPEKVSLIGYHDNRVYASADPDATAIKAGTILSFPLDKQSLSNGKVIWQPKKDEFEATSSLLNGCIYMTIIKNVAHRLVQINLNDKKYLVEELPVPQDGLIEFFRTGPESDFLRITHQSSIVPPTIYFYNSKTGTMQKYLSIDPSFDASQLQRVQKFAKSKDGTMVPYFLIGPKNMKLDASNPTILFGYGGFGQVMIPIYSMLTGKNWLEKGGVYAFANIRGGGEYGEPWHKAGMRDKKQNSFDDFIAIAEDLIQNKVTSPKHLGINGGSNGGLMVTAVAVQRPDLFNAVVADSALTDMLRFDQLLVGPSWINEYGDPKVESEAKYLKKYSPLHNLDAKKQYPEFLILSAGNDDRVHPAHARKMAEKLKELGKPYLLYESEGGGHFGGNLEFTAKSKALGTGFLAEKLGLSSKP